MSTHKFKETRYLDFTSVSCEFCDLSPHSPFILLTCKEALKSSADVKTILDETRAEFAELTKSIREQVDSKQERRLDEHWASLRSVCESRLD